MVPPRVAQKMSVVSVESMAFLAPGPKAAERAQPPGSGRPGGVEATGASPGTVPSWPDRPGGRGAPVGGPAGRSGVWGGVGRGAGGCDFLEALNPPLVRDGVMCCTAEAFAISLGFPPAPMRCCPSGGSKLPSSNDAPLFKMAARPQIPAALSPIADVTSLGCLHPTRASGHEVRLFGT